MLTHDEKKQLQTLRLLQQSLSNTLGLEDRFGRPEDRAAVERLKQEIEAIPQRVRRFAEREDAVQKFGLLIERYILYRALHFLPDVTDLTQTILNIHNEKELSAYDSIVAELIRSLDHLRSIDASQEDIELAILIAQDLPQTQADPTGFLRALGNRTWTYLAYRAKLIEEKSWSLMRLLTGQSPEQVEVLCDVIQEWEAQIPDYRERYAMWNGLEQSKDLEERVAYMRFNLIRQIALLRRLGLTDEKILADVSHEQTHWQAKQTQSKK